MSLKTLLWKSKNETRSLISTPFKTEDKFEELVFSTPEILEDIFLIKRQIRGGNKNGIPDIIGIDNDNNICIIEMKNVSVDFTIIPQVLEYAFWAEQNPDSIKALWLELDNRPDDIEITWDDCSVRIILIAPEIQQSTLDYIDKITYDVDLLVVNRWTEGHNHFLLVDKLEKEEVKRGKVTKGKIEYNEEYYFENRNKKSARYFSRYLKEIDSIVLKYNLDIEKKYNKNYVAYKVGFPILFSLNWVGSKTFAFSFKISKSEAEELDRKSGIQMTKYEHNWKQATYYIDPNKTKTSAFEEYFKKCYERRS